MDVEEMLGISNTVFGFWSRTWVHTRTRKGSNTFDPTLTLIKKWKKSDNGASRRAETAGSLRKALNEAVADALYIQPYRKRAPEKGLSRSSPVEDPKPEV